MKKLIKVSNHKPSRQTIAFQIPLSLLSLVKIEANKIGISYKNLIKIYIARRA